MPTNTTHTAAGSGPHQLIIGSVTVSTLLGGDDTAGELSLVDVRGLPGSGPGAHIDPWRESFYVVEGELTFRVEHDGSVESIVAGSGDSVSIPTGVGHAFSVTSGESARYLIMSNPAGIEAFFADAGEAVESADLPAEAAAFDRERLLAAFAKHELTPYELPA